MSASKPSSEAPVTGHCLCGAVTVEISGAPLRMAQCHCKDCQRASGGGHMSLAFFKSDDVTISGETGSHPVTADSGNINTRHFCPKCGSRVFGENSARAGIVGIPVGILDDTSWFAPDAIVYARDRAPWDRTSTDIPNFDQMPPPPK